MRGDVEGVAGAVVEPADDLHAGARGAVGFGEPVVSGSPTARSRWASTPGTGRRRIRALAWFGGDQASLGQVTGDGRPGDDDTVVVLEVPGDGVWAGVQSGGIELGAEVVDELDEGGVKGAR